MMDANEELAELRAMEKEAEKQDDRDALIILAVFMVVVILCGYILGAIFIN